MLAIVSLVTLVAAQSGQECRLEEHAVIPRPSDQSFLIGRTAAIAVDSTGRLFISDQSGPGGSTIHVVNPDGSRRGTIGRVGSGPGEYRSLDGGLLLLSDSRLLVRDAANGRFVVFSTAGGPAAHWGLRPTYGFTPLLPSTTGFVSLVAFRPGENGFGRDGGQVLVRFDHDGRARDTLTIPELVPEPVATMQSAGGVMRVPVPFAARPLWTWRPGRGFVAARSDSAWIEFHESGRVSRIRFASVRSAFAPGEREAAEAQLRRSTEGGRVIRGATIPRSKPHIRALWADPSDRTWVLHHAPGVPRQETAADGRTVTRWTEPLRMTIVDAEGTPRFRVQGPPVRYDQRIAPAIRGDTLWLAVTDAEGVPRVMRLHITCDAHLTR